MRQSGFVMARGRAQPLPHTQSLPSLKHSRTVCTRQCFSTAACRSWTASSPRSDPLVTFAPPPQSTLLSARWQRLLACRTRRLGSTISVSACWPKPAICGRVGACARYQRARPVRSSRSTKGDASCLRCERRSHLTSDSEVQRVRLQTTPIAQAAERAGGGVECVVGCGVCVCGDVSDAYVCWVRGGVRGGRVGCGGWLCGGRGGGMA